MAMTLGASDSTGAKSYITCTTVGADGYAQQPVCVDSDAVCDIAQHAKFCCR